MASVQNGVHAADFLFVQTATGATLNGTLTLTGVADMTTYFADRPVRVAGRMSTEEFLAFYEPGGTFSEVYSCRSRERCFGSYNLTRALRPDRENVNRLTRIRCACVRAHVCLYSCMSIHRSVRVCVFRTLRMALSNARWTVLHGRLSSPSQLRC